MRNLRNSIDELQEALKEDRAGFIKGLIAAGYVDEVVYNSSGDDDELVRLAIEIYSDLWGAFDKSTFESWVYKLT